MKKLILYIAWGCMAVLCIGFGTLEPTELLPQLALAAMAVVFFVPGTFLLYDAITAGDRKEVLRIRFISIASLVLTLIFLIAFILTAAVGNETADVLYDILIVVSCPMICGQYWLISLFLWSCLLSASFFKPSQK